MMSAMDDPLEDLPVESRSEVVSAIRAVLGVDAAKAEALTRAAEPLWDAMERAGGLVDSWTRGAVGSSVTSSRRHLRSSATPRAARRRPDQSRSVNR